MGTSGAYSGSPGWSGVGGQTQEWLDTGAGTGPGSPLPADPGTTTAGQPSLATPLAGLIGGLGRRLAGGGGGGGGAGMGGAGGPGGGRAGGGGGAGSGRATGRASSVGGRAAAGAYGLRSGVGAALGELGLSLEELRGLPKHEQARRLLDAAMGPSGGVHESELRLANAELILWALNEEAEPAPIDLANRWVVEYVWQVWITEAGPTIRNHSGSGYDSHRVEQEMRAALEACVAGGGLAEGRPLTAGDFEAAIESALASLERIGRTDP